MTAIPVDRQFGCSQITGGIDEKGVKALHSRKNGHKCEWKAKGYMGGQQRPETKSDTKEQKKYQQRYGQYNVREHHQRHHGSQHRPAHLEVKQAQGNGGNGSYGGGCRGTAQGDQQGIVCRFDQPVIINHGLKPFEAAAVGIEGIDQHGRERFVEQQDTRLVNNGSSDGDPLPLTG